MKKNLFTHISIVLGLHTMFHIDEDLTISTVTT